MPQALIEPLVQELDQLATTAGFRMGTAPEIGAAAPPNLKFWANDFAFLVLLVLPENDSALLSRTFLEGSAWMSLVLKAEEKRGRLIDGYLLLAIPSKPDAAMLTEVRRVESDTSVCRKHVLWPNTNYGWTAPLSAVTTLGLPSAMPADNEVIEPDLPFVAKRALEERENGASFEDVASVIEELPENEQEMDAHVD